MRIITYFGFTFLSILIQFCLMDFIQEKLQDGKTLHLNVNVSNVNKESYNNSSRRNNIQVKKRNVNFTLKKDMSGLTPSGASTEMTSTVLDIFYDENTSTTDFGFTTELFTTTEFDNVTEVNYPIDVQPPKANVKPKSIKKDCDCNLMFEICDINCCCDSDCSDQEEQLFGCNEVNKVTRQNDGVCYAYLFNREERYKNNLLDNMLCIVKVNLPEKRKSSHKFMETLPHQHFKWRNRNNAENESKFTKDMYKIGDPLWQLNNRTFLPIELPCPLINDYCTKRKPITFFKNEEIECTVKIKDLEMFRIANLAEQTKIISATNITANSSFLNCSSLYCASWKLLVCNENACEYYNKTVHKSICTENRCTNVALKTDYTFYIHETTIINVTVKFHVREISIDLVYVSQKINVKFLLANRSIDNIVTFSGNPGYQKGLQVIFSRAQSNYTKNFFNGGTDRENYFALPTIENGQCSFPNITSSFITFGTNKRMKCRYVLKNFLGKNKREVCKDMHTKIQEMFYFNKTVAVCPYGNPQHISDEQWIVLNFNNSQQEPVYSLIDAKTSKVLCHNLITKISLSFAFTHADEKGNKILSVKHQVMLSNKSFTLQDMSTVIAIDISFIDVTKPAVFEYASSPHIDINLPKDFFFPSNRSDFQRGNVYYVLVVYCCIVIFK